MKVLIAAGGTAGHIIPALVVAEELKDEYKNTEILFVTTRRKQDYELISKKSFKIKRIFTGKFRRYFSPRNFTDIFAVIFGFFQSFFIILRFNPDVIFSKGGYVSFPVVLAGRLLRKKIIIHESDIILGLANKKSIPFVNKLAVSYPLEFYKDIPSEKLVFSGNPLRKSIKKIAKKEKEKVLLIMGGSQGARKINYAISEILDKLLDDFIVVHQAGSLDLEDLQKERTILSFDKQKRYKVFANVFNEEEYNKILNEADIVISRAGSVFFEFAFLGKPTIMIPLPGHQEKNADFFANHNAAIMIKNEDLTSQVLEKNVLNLLNNKELALRLSQNIAELTSKDAASIIAKETFQLAEGQ